MTDAKAFTLPGKAAEQAGLTPRGIRRWCRRYPGLARKIGGRWRIDTATLDLLMRGLPIGERDARAEADARAMLEDEIKHLRLIIAWCRPRLRMGEYRTRLDGWLAAPRAHRMNRKVQKHMAENTTTA